MPDVSCHPEGARRPKDLVEPCETPSFDFLHKEILASGLFGESSGELPWRLSPEPFAITVEQWEFFQILGEDLLEFYLAADQLFLDSLCNKLPSWVLDYLTMRIDAPIKELGMARDARGQRVRVIRPDVLLTKDGKAITELDSVPGGIGWTAALNMVYENAGFEVIGSGQMMEKNFSRMLVEVAQKDGPYWGIVVSEESADYWHEMVWLGKRLKGLGLDGEVIKPEDLRPCDNGLCGKSGQRIDVLYRFFELFDYRSLPPWELIVYALKSHQVRVTPPIKSYPEEKLLFALFHHPCLEGFWRDRLGAGRHERLRKIFPKTWILDPRPLPPHAIVGDVTIQGRPIQKWEELFTLTQRERHLVIKPSGYSPLAWGSRGVIIGHDQPQDKWARQLEGALDGFHKCPYILQQYRDPRRVAMRFYNTVSGDLIAQEGRARLCPYYMVYDGKAHLSGILATICPLDKKLIHGMQSAVMAPCRVAA